MGTAPKCLEVGKWMTCSVDSEKNDQERRKERRKEREEGKEDQKEGRKEQGGRREEGWL